MHTLFSFPLGNHLNIWGLYGVEAWSVFASAWRQAKALREGVPDSSLFVCSCDTRPSSSHLHSIAFRSFQTAREKENFLKRRTQKTHDLTTDSNKFPSGPDKSCGLISDGAPY